MKVLFIFLILFFNTIVENKWKLLTDNTNKYTIEYPADWQPSNVGDIEYIKTPLTDSTDKFAENINILVVPNSDSSLDMAATANGIKKQYQAIIKGYEYINSGDYQVGSLKMFHINYKALYGTTNLNFTQYFYLTKSNIYIITSTTPVIGDPSFPALSEQVVKTFKLL